MKPFLTLDDYKQLLIDYKMHEDDEETRKRHINRHYSDEFLNKIVVETQILLMDILGKQRICKKDTFFYRIDINEVIGLSNGCIGGGDCDLIFSIDNEPVYYSEKIIKEYLGKEFMIDMYDEIIEEYNDKEEAGYINYIPYLTISGPNKIIHSEKGSIKHKVKK